MLKLCASVLGGWPGINAGEQPVASSIFGTSKSSSFASLYPGLEEGAVDTLSTRKPATLLASRISPRTPHTTVVSPILTTALPSACVREPLLICGVRNSVGERPFARDGGEEEEAGWRCASRYGWGESLAKVSRGKESVDWGVVDAMLCSLELLDPFFCVLTFDVLARLEILFT